MSIGSPMKSSDSSLWRNELKAGSESSTSAMATTSAMSAVKIASPRCWRISWPRVAPTTLRIATSRARFIARAVARLTKLMQAMIRMRSGDAGEGEHRGQLVPRAVLVARLGGVEVDVEERHELELQEEARQLQDAGDVELDVSVGEGRQVGRHPLPRLRGAEQDEDPIQIGVIHCHRLGQLAYRMPLPARIFVPDDFAYRETGSHQIGPAIAIYINGINPVTILQIVLDNNLLELWHLQFGFFHVAGSLRIFLKACLKQGWQLKSDQSFSLNKIPFFKVICRPSYFQWKLFTTRSICEIWSLY